MPYAEELDEYLDQLIPIVRPWGEDLVEDHFYLDRPWLEFQDDDRFHDIILHFFNEGGEYLRSVNGDVTSGSWRYLPRSNKLLIDHHESELFDLAFMDSNFFILRKHGDQQRFGRPKYFMMVSEQLGRNLEWRDALELLFNTYRSNNNFYIILALIIIVAIAIVLILSVY